MTTSQVGRSQGAAATRRVTLERHKDHSPLGDGVAPRCSPRHRHFSATELLSPPARPGRVKVRGNRQHRESAPKAELSGMPIPRLATHFPAVWTGTTFAPCANPRLRHKSPFGDTPALSQPPWQGLEGHWHQQRDWDICHHAASDKPLFSVLQYLCLLTGWCLGMANRSQINNITSRWWCPFTDGIFQVAAQ